MSVRSPPTFRSSSAGLSLVAAASSTSVPSPPKAPPPRPPTSPPPVAQAYLAATSASKVVPSSSVSSSSSSLASASSPLGHVGINRNGIYLASSAKHGVESTTQAAQSQGTPTKAFLHLSISSNNSQNASANSSSTSATTTTTTTALNSSTIPNLVHATLRSSSPATPVSPFSSSGSSPAASPSPSQNSLHSGSTSLRNKTSPQTSVMKATSIFLKSTAQAHAASVTLALKTDRSTDAVSTPTPLQTTAYITSHAYSSNSSDHSANSLSAIPTNTTASSLSSTTTTTTNSYRQPQQPLQRRTTFTLDDFDLGTTLGTGSFGRVRFAKYRRPLNNEEANRRVAIKMLRKKEVVRTNQVEHIQNEREILHRLASPPSDAQGSQDPWSPTPPGSPHPFVVRLFGTFMDEKFLYMCLEFVRGGEFFTHLRTRGHMKNHEAQFYAASVASVFAHLHSLDIVYRDLKPENLLLDHNGYIKVTDFGFAKHIPDDKTFTLCGTPEYLAPEILLNQGHGKGVDWWALGVLVYEMLSGRAPFVHEDTMEVYQMILRADYILPGYFDPDARSFVRRLLQVDLTKRYGCLAAGARDVLLHRWLAGVDFAALLRKQHIGGVPILPPTKNADDTSNFEDYPDSDSEDVCQNYAKGRKGQHDTEGEAKLAKEVARHSFLKFPGIVVG